MPGVAEGKELIGVPTGNDVSADDRVKALFHGSMSEEMYQVSTALSFQAASFWVLSGVPSGPTSFPNCAYWELPSPSNQCLFSELHVSVWGLAGVPNTSTPHFTIPNNCSCILDS